MAQPSPTRSPGPGRGAPVAVRPAGTTPGPTPRFPAPRFPAPRLPTPRLPTPCPAIPAPDRPPTRRDLGRLAGRAVGATALAGTVGTLATLRAGPAAAAGAAPGGHLTRVLRVRDPTAAGGTRPTRVSYVDPVDLATATVPVVYLLHGLPGAAGDFEGSGATTALFAAAAALGLRLVVVCPAGTSMHPDDPRNDTEWGDDVEGRWQLETWVHGALRAAVEGTAVRATADRIIGGFSMGGFGAAMIGMRHPALYGSIAAIAGYFHLDDPDGVFGDVPEDQVRHRPDHLIFPHRTQRYLLADAHDDPLALTAPETLRFTGLLAARGYVPRVYRPPGGHDYGVVVAVMPALALFIAQR